MHYVLYLSKTGKIPVIYCYLVSLVCRSASCIENHACVVQLILSLVEWKLHKVVCMCKSVWCGC